MKKYLTITLAALLITAVPQVAKAQTKAAAVAVAHIDLDSILQIFPAYKSAMDTAQSYYAQLEKEMYSMQVELQRKATEFDSLSKTMSPFIKQLKQKICTIFSNEYRNSRLAHRKILRISELLYCSRFTKLFRRP